MTFLFVGGGTLGSLNPLIAVAKEIVRQQPSTRVAFWTSVQALDQTVLREAQLPFRTIYSGKLRRYFSLRTCVDVFVIIFAFFVSVLRLLRERPQAVVSAGSYVAVPVSIAAWCLHIPVIIYQQDVQLGLANRIMSLFARVRTATTSERASLFGRPAQVVGFALRSDVALGDARKAITAYQLHPAWKTLVVIGGSTGAKRVNELVIQALPLFPKELNIVHITGPGKQLLGQRDGYVSIPFTNAALPDVYAIADVVICRAGSNVLAEMLALQKYCIIIPLPGTHQEANARELEHAGAVVLYEETITPEKLANQVRIMLPHSGATSYPAALATLWDVHGTQRLAKLILQYT